MSEECKICPLVKARTMIALFHYNLEKLLKSSHKTLYAMVCRDMYKKLKLMGVTVGREKGMVL